MENREKSNIQAFRMYENLYFVGSTRVSVHIIETDEGLIMLDTGYPDMYEQILDSMSDVGLSPKDICAIFHSHGHIDHFGCTQKFKALSGAKTYISRIDNDIVNGTYNLSWAEELKYEVLPPFDCDVLIEDGDTFTFGDTKVRCVLSPGHTQGTMSYFINIGKGEKSIIAAMHGGAGSNSMSAKFLNKYGLSFDCREQFVEALHKLKEEHVDLVMGNHPGQNDTKGKLLKVLSGNGTVIDSEEWVRVLETAEYNLKDHMEKEKNM